MKLKLIKYPVVGASVDLTLGKYYECKEGFYADNIYIVNDDVGDYHEVEKSCFEEHSPEWDGKGLPPVGTECECIIDTGEYLPCKVVDHGKDYVVVHFHPNIHNYKVDWTRTGCRSIKSEKDKEIEEMCRHVKSFAVMSQRKWTDKQVCEYLYNHGYRKIK